METKNQTAVEWLMEHITYDNGYGQRWVSFKEATDLNIYFQKALAMEKEQIMDAFEEGENNSIDYFVPEHRIKEAEQYYNETYGK